MAIYDFNDNIRTIVILISAKIKFEGNTFYVFLLHLSLSID